RPAACSSFVPSPGSLLFLAVSIAAAPTQSFTYAILDTTGNQVGSYTTPLYTQRINPAFGTVIEANSNANSYYNALIVQVNKRYSGWFQGNAAYTYSHAI